MSLRPLPDTMVLKRVAAGIRQMRLNSNLSQNDLAQKSGLSRLSIARLERGEKFNVMTMIQVLRGLEQLDLLMPFVEKDVISPMLRFKLEQKLLKQQRKRVRKGKAK